MLTSVYRVRKDVREQRESQENIDLIGALCFKHGDVALLMMQHHCLSICDQLRENVKEIKGHWLPGFLVHQKHLALVLVSCTNRCYKITNNNNYKGIKEL